MSTYFISTFNGDIMPSNIVNYEKDIMLIFITISKKHLLFIT